MAFRDILVLVSIAGTEPKSKNLDNHLKKTYNYGLKINANNHFKKSEHPLFGGEIYLVTTDKIYKTISITVSAKVSSILKE